jgi:solute:Na+ symporter, SSS family
VLLNSLDLSVFALYAVGLIFIAWWVSREKVGHQKNANDYFLAGNTLPWSGSGYVIGMAIGAYELMAGITLIIIAKYFLPIFLAKNIYTMPQFLEQRYDNRVRTVMAIFWLALYVFVNLTSVLYLGSLAISKFLGVEMIYGMIFLVLFSLTYSIYGGLKAVAMTDMIQVVLLIIGGLLVTYLALDKIGDGAGVLQGFSLLYEKAPERFDMILSSDHPNYIDLPGISVLLGGMWIVNIAYWGFNQYIIQR